MAKRLSTQSVKSKQSSVLRYIVSTSKDKTSKDLGVSTVTLERFAKANPETIKKNPSRYRKLLESNPKQIAKEKDVKLVQRLSGKRLRHAYGTYYESERATKAIRYTQAVRERRRVIQEGKIRYIPTGQAKTKIARKQILSQLSGMTSNRIMEQYNEGTLSEDEARSMLQELWINSGMTAGAANNYFDSHT